MNSVTIKLISPSGVMMDLAIPAKEEDKGIMALLDRAEDTAEAIVNRGGWKFADQRASEPSVKEMASGPTFCGLLCSTSLNDRSFPSFVMVGEKMAKRREKQGDTWYSYSDADDSYHTVLSFRAGDEVPPVFGLPEAATK